VLDSGEVPRWEPGGVIVRREVLNDGRCWLEFPVTVVMNQPDLLATYIREGTPLRFPPDAWPTPDGLHPWHQNTSWQGHGVLMLQRPRDSYAVWVFWSGPDRDFDCWYVNLQEPFRRTAIGCDTQDLELDIVVPSDGSWQLKDEEVLEQRISEGRFTSRQVADIRTEGRRVTDDLDRGTKWWADDWMKWRPGALDAHPIVP
jgi:hypothetical protein